MILIIGGEFQGKLNYVKNSFSVSDGDICDLKKGNIDFSKRVIYNFQEISNHGICAEEFLARYQNDIKDKIIVVCETGCGIVPVKKELRRKREDAGRAAAEIAKLADRVDRVVCGIGQILKKDGRVCI